MFDFTLNKFFDVPSDFSFWQFMNSQFLATFVGAIVAVIVARYGKKTADAVAETAASQGAASATEQARQIEAQEADTVEDLEASGGKDFRNEARKLVDQAKQYLEEAAANDPDGRHRRTYDALYRYDYVPLAVALNVREQITAKQLAAAATIFTRWRAYEKGKVARRPVSEAVFNTLSDAYKLLQAA